MLLGKKAAPEEAIQRQRTLGSGTTCVEIPAARMNRLVGARGTLFTRKDHGKFLKIITISKMPFVQPFREIKSRVFMYVCFTHPRGSTSS